MATAARAGNREIIRFEPGKPETVILKFSEGKEISGQYGAQFMYTTTDDRIFFLDPDVARSLEDLRPGRGEEVRIGKTRRAKGGFDWQIERVPVRRPQPVADSMPDVRMPSGYASEPPPFAPLAEEVAPMAPIAPTVNSTSVRMMACFKAAIDAVSEAQTYANRKSLGITFTSENITSAALSCYINECKGGR